MARSDTDSQRFWITSNIGWLSVCILAAAWGNRLLPGNLVYLWSFFGAFGLAAALGLAVAKNRRKNFISISASHDGAEVVKGPAVRF
jgi:hypothetical protein